MRLWLILCLLVSTLISARSLGARRASVLDIRKDELAGMSNGERMKRGLPLKKPARKGTMTYHAFQARASDGATMQNVVVQASQEPVVKRAGSYLAYDAAKNGFVITSDVASAVTFSVPGSTVGNTQVRMYTNDGLYYLGAAASQTIEGGFTISAVKTSDLGNQAGSSVQTTIWSFAGVPGSLSGTFFYLDSTSPIYLSPGEGGVIIGSRNVPAQGLRITLSLQTVSDAGTTVMEASAPANGGQPVNTDEFVDPRLAVIDSAINGGQLDQAAIDTLLQCLTGTITEECEQLLASLPPPEQPSSNTSGR